MRASAWTNWIACSVPILPGIGGSLGATTACTAVGPWCSTASRRMCSASSGRSIVGPRAPHASATLAKSNLRRCNQLCWAPANGRPSTCSASLVLRNSRFRPKLVPCSAFDCLPDRLMPPNPMRISLPRRARLEGEQRSRMPLNYLLNGKAILVALPGLEPGLFALRGRRVNQLHHNAMSTKQETVRPRPPQPSQCTKSRTAVPIVGQRL